MKERPIRFTAPMVRAIIEGRKTQTRLVVKPQPHQTCAGLWKWRVPDGACGYSEDVFIAKIGRWSTVPYAVGDRLWVRETFFVEPERLIANPCKGDFGGRIKKEIFYRATYSTPQDICWRPSIHMPRWACRMVLEITDVRVQRLQDISEADARAEGFANRADYIAAVLAMYGLRDDADPWMWAISFKCVEV
ncbi:MAG TPA: hypothetical protein VE028_04090 [Nitratidesulfovibrio sp.]|nr:hypothetical protein [Nitratidesulfovibrio sp.]